MSEDSMKESRMSDRELHTYLLNIANIYNVIKKNNKDIKRGESKHGIIPCLICNNNIFYSIKKDGNISMKCSTYNCISFKPTYITE